MELQNCMTDMLSTLASSFGDKALMLVDKDGTPAGHILGTEMGGAIEYEKYKRKFDHLPTGFVELEYLESTGTQYINTGYKRTAGSSYKMEVDLLPSNYNGAQFYFTLGGDWPAYFVGIYNGKVALYGGYELQNSTGRHVYTLSLNEANTTGTLTDGTESASYTRSSANYSDYAMLFCRQTSQYLGRCKIFSAKIYKGAAMLFDLVPAMRSSDGEVGMFDLITGTFLTNAGTGTFKYGHIMPEGYTEVAYISKSGVAYINSGINQKDTVGYSIDVAFTAFDSINQYALGAYRQGDYFGVWKESATSAKMCFKNVMISNTISDSDTTFHNFEVNFLNSRKMKYDGVVKQTISETKSATEPTVFIGDTNYSAHFASSLKFGRVKISDGSTLVFNGVPALRNSDSEIGMYDLVSNTFLTNAGTGTFSYGEL